MNSMLSKGTPRGAKTQHVIRPRSGNILLKATRNDRDYCRACDKRHKQYKSYPDHRATRVEVVDDSGWIQCSYCKSWLHNGCTSLQQYEIPLIGRFSCKACEPEKGPSTVRKVVAPGRIKFYSTKEINMPIQVGTKTWVENFTVDEAERFKSPPPEKVAIVENGHDFLRNFSRHEEWKKPYLVKHKDGLDMEMPEPGTVYIDEIILMLGEDIAPDTIDVFRQATEKMTLGRYRELLASPTRDRLFNILSLEFSETNLGDVVRPPAFVRELSWTERYWPETPPTGSTEVCERRHKKWRPNVEQFCLMGMGGSFTNFHVDFGGSSVWYHVYKGKKIFYIVEPTRENLDAYQANQVLADNRAEFLGDIYKDKCWRVVVDEGMTLLVPAGWIHAVYTPVDSLVFGGNYLTDLNAEMQCEVHAQEGRCRYTESIRYPNFELICWYAARTFTKKLRASNNSLTSLPMHIIRGAKALMESLDGWANLRPYSSYYVKTPSTPFIHGESQREILNALSKEYNKLVVRVGRTMGRIPRMNREIVAEETEEEEEGGEETEEEEEGGEEENKEMDESKGSEQDTSNEASKMEERGVKMAVKRKNSQKESESIPAKERKKTAGEMNESKENESEKTESIHKPAYTMKETEKR